MKPVLLQRLFALAGVGLVASILALAVVRHNDAANGLPGSAPAPGGGWFTALAGPAPLPARPRQTACGHTLTAATLGVAHPVLPCGAKIYIEFGNKRVLTQVIDHGPQSPGREFNVTRALAERIGLNSVQTIRWRFAVTK